MTRMVHMSSLGVPFWGWLDRMESGQRVTFNPIDAIVARTALQSQL